MSTTGLPQTAFRDKRILVVDDEGRLAESLASLLRGVGYKVEFATSGAAGLELARHGEYDLVITDLRMEGVDGFDIIDYIVRNAPDTALMIITAHASTESAIEAIHQRVADYIPKPFDFEVLRNSIERVFAQQETERLRRDLIHMLTHDIKVPLTSVLGFAQLLVDEEGNAHASAAHFAEMIVSNSQKILGMLENYLTNARVEEGRLDVLREHFPLEHTIAETLHMLGPEFRKKHIDVSAELAPAPPEFTGDEPLLARAAANLLSNAAKYTDHHGAVQVTLEFTQRDAILTVRNTGEIEQKDTHVVFERYRRTGSARGVGGSGLGLHVVRCVAQAHGGDATCESSAEVVTFRLRIPLQAPGA